MTCVASRPTEYRDKYRLIVVNVGINIKASCPSGVSDHDAWVIFGGGSRPAVLPDPAKREEGDEIYEPV